MRPPWQKTWSVISTRDEEVAWPGKSDKRFEFDSQIFQVGMPQDRRSEVTIVQ
ncbi:MAG: hypothetical protein HY714_06290 [Candidatus Omnitrophica bacterium]|nr:hypothetical protein [Candidatus Omnitrophota bacterium]